MSLKPKYRVEKALPLAQTPHPQRRPLPGPLPAHCGSPPSGARPGRGADDPAVTPPSRAAAAPPNQKKERKFFVRTGKLWAAFRPYLWITLASAVFALGFDWCYVPNQITLGGMTGLGQIIHAIVPCHPGGQCGHRPQPAPVPAGLAAAGVEAAGLLPLRHRRHLPGGGPAGRLLLLPAHGPHAGLRLRRRADRAVPWDGVPPGSHHRRHRSHRPAAEAPLRPSAHGHPGHGGGPGGHRPGRSGLPQPEQRPCTGWSPCISPPWSSTGCSTAWTTPRWPISSATAPREIIRSISTELDRGVTILRGAGAWSGEAKDVLMCAFKQKQIVALKRAVKETDPPPFSSCAMPTRCWVRASTAITSMTCDPFIFSERYHHGRSGKTPRQPGGPRLPAPPTSPPQMRRPPIWTARSMEKRWASAGP